MAGPWPKDSAALTSRRYFGTDNFRPPTTLKKRGMATDSGSTNMSERASVSTATLTAAPSGAVGRTGGMGGIPEWVGTS